MASSSLFSILTIAGSDSSGGAGIQADLKTIAAHGCYGASVITALTAQNTTGVQGVHPCPSLFVKQQISSVLDDLEINAIKTGMLYDAEITQAVVDVLKAHYADSTSPPLICDPVCVSTSGHTLLQPKAIRVLVDELFPLATVITPNISEAELLLSHGGQSSQIETLEDMLSAAANLLSLGSRSVLLKGGHINATMDDVERVASSRPEISIVTHGLFGENIEILQLSGTASIEASQLVVDILSQSQGNTVMFLRPRIDSKNTHGTGCTLSTAIACELARGGEIMNAIKHSTVYTHLGIETAIAMGKGHGPLNHLHSIARLSIPARTPSNPYPLVRYLIQSTQSEWKAYVEHDFVRLLGKGTLDRGCFIHFIKQDYHYLKYYARAYGLLAAKTTTFEAIGTATKTIQNIIQEISTHKSFCALFGVTDEELEETPESPATSAYGAYLIDIGLQGDATRLLMALLACLLGYGEVGLWLKKEAAMPNSWVVLEGNPFKEWIEDYSGSSYQAAVVAGLYIIENKAEVDPPSPARLEEWRQVWLRCTKLEKGFWDMAMTQS